MYHNFNEIKGFGEKMKFGLDIHGVSDTNPKFFSEFSALMVANGHEIHVITGPKFEKVEQTLKDAGIKFTHFFSIVEEEEKNGVTIRYDENGDPFMDAEIWNRSKAKYCKLHGIDLHFDDSDKYGEHFKTPYARYIHK